MVRSSQHSERRVGAAHQDATTASAANARLAHRLAVMYACAAAVALAVAPRNLLAQIAASPAVAAAAPLPEPIYWKQQLFLVPYQWPSASAPASARLVTLYISRDRGASWQKISEGRPDLKAFNYRAEGDGEYWFAIRTLDNRGQIWPVGPYQAELRVTVDTTIPRIDELRAHPTPEGAIEIQCRATDVNLDPASLKVEAQLATSATWQAVTLQQSSPGVPSSTGTANLPSALAAPIRALWQPPAGARPIAIRATIADRAGNSTVFQTAVAATRLVAGPQLTSSAPAMVSQPASTAPALTSTAPVAPPLAASAATSVGSVASAASPAAPPTNQSWSPAASTTAPFRLWTTGNPASNDGLTVYGNPPVVKQSPPVNIGPTAASAASDESARRVPAQFVGAAKPEAVNQPATSASSPSGPQFFPLEPFRQTTASPDSASATTTSGPALVPVGSSNLPVASTASTPSNAGATPIAADVTPVTPAPPTNRPTSPPKMVGSRTFSLEYDLEDSSRTGVSRVELWGTRDGGQTWTRTAVDDDCQSPLVVTVDNEGLYGFKILVQPANSAAINPPRGGEEPELWVSVDLKRPIVELTSLERGEGNLADHLILHWRAQDNNLEPRPIALFFCSRPTGPWQPIARNLENTGEYAWRVERFVPDRVYLRVEARDVAGNLAVFQTRGPVELNAVQTAGHLREAAR